MVRTTARTVSGRPKYSVCVISLTLVHLADSHSQHQLPQLLREEHLPGSQIFPVSRVRQTSQANPLRTPKPTERWSSVLRSHRSHTKRTPVFFREGFSREKYISCRMESRCAKNAPHAMQAQRQRIRADKMPGLGLSQYSQTAISVKFDR